MSYGADAAPTNCPMVASSIRPVRQSGIDRLEPRHLVGQREPHSGQPDSGSNWSLEYIALATACALMSLPGGSETRRLASASALACSRRLRVFSPWLALTDGSGSGYADAMARRDLIAE